MKKKNVFIIAEAGVNHNGSIEIAREMIDAARKAGADAIKFQTFRAEDLARKDTPKALYQQAGTARNESQYDMLKKLELDERAYSLLMKQSRLRGIQFLSSPFDAHSVDLLNRLGLEIFKVPSGEITNMPYLRQIGALRKKVILSTGMAYLREIEDALRVLQQSGTGIDDITVLHCNTEYPTPMRDVNLGAMISIREAFKVKVGYSDHTKGIEIPMAAVALGASIIEKHFTLDKNMDGPDHRSSLDPDEFRKMVTGIRNIEKAFGDGIKRPSRSEQKNKGVVRKSLVATKAIKIGELFSADNMGAKRPGTGISPMEWDRVIGKKAHKNFEKDDFISLNEEETGHISRS